MELINKYRTALEQACLTYQVKTLYAFGSILTNNFNDDSDIDFVVSIRNEDPLVYAENYFDLKFELERIFNRKIDLLEQKSLKNNTFAKNLNIQKKLVYENRSKSLA